MFVILHTVIAVNKVGNIESARSTEARVSTRPVTTETLGLDPFSARSIVLSVLLGTHPPSLPIGSIVALSELFSIPAGTMRTALSRLVAAGDLVNDDGRYQLTDRLVARQRAQDEGRRDVDDAWDRTWWTVIALSDRRSVAARRSFRAELDVLRFGELRPDTWIRPANLSPGDEHRLFSIPDAIVTRGSITTPDGPALARRLWPLDTIADRMRSLLAHMETTAAPLSGTDTSALPEAFAISAAVVRTLRTEPRLPAALTPPDWPAAQLRSTYDRYEADFQQLLGVFLTRGS